MNNDEKQKENEMYFFYSPGDFRGEQPGIPKPERRRKEKGVPQRIKPPVPSHPEPKPEPERVPEKTPEHETVEI